MNNKDPKTDSDFENLIAKCGYEVIDHDIDSFSVRNIKSGSCTHLEATDYSSALFEAWHLVKP